MVGDEQAENVRPLMCDPISLPAQPNRLAGLFLDGFLLFSGELVNMFLEAVSLREAKFLGFAYVEIALRERQAVCCKHEQQTEDKFMLHKKHKLGQTEKGGAASGCPKRRAVCKEQSMAAQNAIPIPICT